MESWQREYHVARIVAGVARYRIGGLDYLVGIPNLRDRFAAARVYRDARERAIFDGVFDAGDMKEMMAGHGFWTAADEELLSKWDHDLENMKVGLFENRTRSDARLSLRTAIRHARVTIESLEERKHAMDHLTADGVALAARYRYLIGSSLRLAGNEPYWPSGDWTDPDPIIDDVIEAMASDRLHEPDYRELSRTDPWRSTWGSRHGGRGAIDVPSCEMTDDQRNLLLWSSVYDNIRDHPDCPADAVLDDDDMLDGWLIIQRRTRDADRVKSLAESIGDNIGDEKMRNRLKGAEEMFLMADSIDDAREIDSMNDSAGLLIKSQKMQTLKARGEVREEHMPDSVEKQTMQFNQLVNQRMRNLHGRP